MPDPETLALETGTWTVVKGGTGLYLQSSDFTHDAILQVNGDFESNEQELDYAQEIARRLNAQRPELSK